MPVNRGIGHFLVGDIEKPVPLVIGTVVDVVTLVIVGIGNRKIRNELQTGRYLIFQVHTGRDTLHLLLDYGTGLVVISEGRPETCLISSSRYRKIVVVCKTYLCHSIDPIGIVIVIFVLIGVPDRVIIECRNIAVCFVLIAIEIGLLHQHGIVVTVEHLDTLGLLVCGKLVCV